VTDDPKNEVERLRDYMPRRESAILPSHIKTLDLLDQLYLMKASRRSAEAYYLKGWLETMRADIEDCYGETLEALAGKLTMQDIEALHSSKTDPTMAHIAAHQRYGLWRGDIKPTLYTAIGDYSATGEGMTINVVIGGAYSEPEFLVKAVTKVGAWFGIGLSFHEGVPPAGNPIVDLMISPELRRLAERIGPAFDHAAHIHYNLS
jgi:hypothetical protein